MSNAFVSCDLGDQKMKEPMPQPPPDQAPPSWATAARPAPTTTGRCPRSTCSARSRSAGVTLRNRIVMSPMCQYIADGRVGRRLAPGPPRQPGRRRGGAGDGRGHGRHPRTAGSPPATWASGATQHVEPLARIARFVHSQGAVAGIQLAHAGRKASCDLPWKGGAGLKTPEAGGWTVVGPSPVPFNEGDPVPAPLDEAGIDGIVAAFEAAARRALAAGFRRDRDPRGPRLPAARVPLAAEQPPDRRYGGSLENRMRLLLRVAERLRKLVPGRAAAVRAHLGDRLGGGRAGTSSSRWSSRGRLKDLGVDLIDVSSGGLVPEGPHPGGQGLPGAVRPEDPRRGGDHDRGGRADHRGPGTPTRS